jgi:hypothetical protein
MCLPDLVRSCMPDNDEPIRCSSTRIMKKKFSVELVDCHIASQKRYKRQKCTNVDQTLRSQLALPSTGQLGASAGNAELTSLLHLGLEDDDVTLLPHLGHQRLAGNHNTCEADLDVLELAVSPHDRLAGNTERAQTVEDGLLEAADLAELGVDVQRVAVSRQAVDGSLLFGRLLLDNRVGLALRCLVDAGRGTTVGALAGTAEAAGTTDEDGALVVEEVLAGLLVLGGRAGDDEAGVALVDNLDEAGV